MERNIYFRISILASDRTVKIDSDVVIIDVKCNSNIELEAVDPPNGFIQYQNASIKPKFTFANYKSTTDACPLTSMAISGSWGMMTLATGLTFNFDPKRTEQEVIPLNDKIGGKYKFFIYA